jgi:hypothetical protein
MREADKYPERTPKQGFEYWQKRIAGAQAGIRQGTRVRAVANRKGIDPWDESEALFGCTYEVLSSGASRALADWIDCDEFVSAVSPACAFCNAKMESQASNRICLFCALNDGEAA